MILSKDKAFKWEQKKQSGTEGFKCLETGGFHSHYQALGVIHILFYNLCSL
jgi:hypothetical protein